MPAMNISAERENTAPITVSYDFGETLDEMSERFTAAVVHSHAKRSFVSALQSFIRNQIDIAVKKGEEASAEVVQAAVAKWKPGQKRAGKSLVDKTSDLLDKMSPADRQLVLKAYAKKAREEAAQGDKHAN